MENETMLLCDCCVAVDVDVDVNGWRPHQRMNPIDCKE